jgi:hypothetical protein
LTSSRTGTSTSVREKEIKHSFNLTTATPRTPPISSILTGSILGRKLDRKEEEGRWRIL